VEYIAADSSGFALDQVAAFLIGQAEQNDRQARVIGLLMNCGGLDVYLREAAPVTVECPYITLDGAQQSAIAALVDQRASEAGPSAFDLWIALENSPYVSLEGIGARYEPVTAFARPDNLTRITLYRVMPSDGDADD
jgi:hypothetical protein